MGYTVRCKTKFTYSGLWFGAIAGPMTALGQFLADFMQHVRTSDERLRVKYLVDEEWVTRFDPVLTECDSNCPMKLELSCSEREIVIQGDELDHILDILRFKFDEPNAAYFISSYNGGEYYIIEGFN